MKESITMAHGNGGVMTSKIINDVILKTINGNTLENMNDAALVDNKYGFTTDSFVIYPHFFNGGDIGKLSVCGTINDLVMGGCIPKYLSLSIILEEGYEIEKLQRIIESVKTTCNLCDVKVVTGDTKVVDKGHGSGIYINTSGIGERIDNMNLSRDNIQEGDAVIITGDIGDHGVSILCERENLLEGQLSSDCMSLVKLIPLIKKYSEFIRIMRDPTRGGVATTLNEFVENSDISITIMEEKLPLNEKVVGACEIFGLDPLYSANEGKGIIIIDGSVAKEFISELKNINEFNNASIIGEVNKEEQGKVLFKSRFGGRRILGKLTHDMLPRIC
ncbi:hydrogenase expression/formation protein HypE [Oceanirhabdus sp. W0125-5]|uniref:hydrogenase expression/formation protein HypE n=1 Tax=Oceanirhabdus sp. W0125-5 TaxID=2999116 RepID=UPI0022F2E263|nr:hydrogenase expression/formation protein HypE [Oceanirhabdus sp. W0125-5]WBW95398.1 hydrogenase expression/formation protein HypE [Oceanirhabdus sp. W0125-5]